jgi:hypothetical protein
MRICEYIEEIIEEQGRRKDWVAERSGIKYKTFLDKLDKDTFTAYELVNIGKLLDIDLNKLKEGIENNDEFYYFYDFFKVIDGQFVINTDIQTIRSMHLKSNYSLSDNYIQSKSFNGNTINQLKEQHIETIRSIVNQIINDEEYVLSISLYLEKQDIIIEDRNIGINIKRNLDMNDEFLKLIACGSILNNKYKEKRVILKVFTINEEDVEIIDNLEDKDFENKYNNETQNLLKKFRNSKG